MSRVVASHLSPDQLDRLLSLPPAGAGPGPWAAHLLEGCARCVGELRRRLAERYREAARLTVRAILDEKDPHTELLDQVVSRVRAWELLLEAETAGAPALAGELLRLPSPERLASARHSRRYQSLELCRHLARAARDEVFRDPAHAIELARLAVEITYGLEGAGYPAGIAADVRAICWGALGNAYRVASDLFEAERALRCARAFVLEGSGHPLVRADVASLLGSLRMVQTRYAEAREVLEEAVATYREFGSSTQEGKVLLQLADALAEEGERNRAIAMLDRARDVLKSEEPRLALYAGHSMAIEMLFVGETENAWELFIALQEEYAAHSGDFTVNQRRLWLEARLCAARSDPRRAEELYRAVCKAFLEREAAYDYALVTLDLAVFLLGQGRAGEVRKLAEELIVVFSSRQVHRHALAAIAVFQNAAASDRLTLDLARELIHYLRRARNNPYLPLTSPA